jgi:Eco57I restriction-modification methylase
VTQLFTEDYMVRFLLENSLGAWWAGRHPDSPLLETFTYLRFTEEGAPAAGTFGGWPETVAEITVMDPCCASGHFLTVAFEMLTAMRAEEEGLSPRAAGDAVIERNLFGLEIDPRCTQIAAFALALSAWRSGGYRELPAPNIACSGIGVAGQLADWKKLAAGDAALEKALTALHEQFRTAPELGSLIDPRRATEEGHLFSVDYNKVAPLLEQLLSREEDPETQVAGWAAAGIAWAASLLARTYTLVATNVPYLGRGKQDEVLRRFCEGQYPESKADLATVMLERAQAMVGFKGCYAVVTPEYWFSLSSYRKMRTRALRNQVWLLVALLGPRSFGEISGEVVRPTLSVFSNRMPAGSSCFAGVDVAEASSLDEKALLLRNRPHLCLNQVDLLAGPDARIVFAAGPTAALLQKVATASAGVQTGDNPRFTRLFWELSWPARGWVYQQGSVKGIVPYGGRERVLYWEGGSGVFRDFVAQQLGDAGIGAWIRGTHLQGTRGVAVTGSGSLPVSIFTGELFTNAVAVVTPRDEHDLPAIWSYCASDEFARDVRRLDRKVIVTNLTLLKVPFDLERWTKVAADLYPDGLPQPYSNDPTQWLFKGNPTDSVEPLQVAVARFLGYHWPEQEPDRVHELADADGAVPIPAIAGEASAAERLRALLERAWGDAWSPGKLSELLSQAGAGGKDLETWLRESFFASHARLFHNRPFIWHIWDGRKDGFGVLVNYHRLDRQLLDRITHTLLGSWIETQHDQIRKQLPGAEARLVAAQDLRDKLELIAEGEPPYDIYVRWKPLAEQPIGWDPDLNDGVRLNIRPFVTAGVIRAKFTINWNKDRGMDPNGSERLNDRHYTRAEKQSAREKGGR